MADWLIKANELNMMIIFNVEEKEIVDSVRHYNKIGKLQKVIYSYKQVKVNFEVVA